MVMLQLKYFDIINQGTVKVNMNAFLLNWEFLMELIEEFHSSFILLSLSVFLVGIV